MFLVKIPAGNNCVADYDAFRDSLRKNNIRQEALFSNPKISSILSTTVINLLVTLDSLLSVETDSKCTEFYIDRLSKYAFIAKELAKGSITSKDPLKQFLRNVFLQNGINYSFDKPTYTAFGSLIELVAEKNKILESEIKIGESEIISKLLENSKWLLNVTATSKVRYVKYEEASKFYQFLEDKAQQGKNPTNAELKIHEDVLGDVDIQDHLINNLSMISIYFLDTLLGFNLDINFIEFCKKALAKSSQFEIADMQESLIRFANLLYETNKHSSKATANYCLNLGTQVIQKSIKPDAAENFRLFVKFLDTDKTADIFFANNESAELLAAALTTISSGKLRQFLLDLNRISYFCGDSRKTEIQRAIANLLKEKSSELISGRKAHTMAKVIDKFFTPNSNS